MKPASIPAPSSVKARVVLLHIPADAVAGRDILWARFQLRLAQVTLDIQAPVPKGSVTLRDLLPVLRPLAEAIVQVACDTTAAEGRRVSCRAHCGACCRQVVPITEAEACVIAAVMAALPEARRHIIQQRFAAAREKLAAAGLLPRLLAAAAQDDPAARRETGLEYFAQQIPCPFLEDESCSIYPDRPITCREYLVTNDPCHCADPRPETIAKVRLPVDLGVALARTGSAGPAFAARWILLILAPEWAAANARALPTRPGPEWFGEILRHLAGATVPPPP